jgi:hypothetical protein
MTDDLAALAAGLTKAQREAVMFGKCGLRSSHDEYSSDCICAADASDDLCPLGLAYWRNRYPNGIVLTPLGLALRAHLKDNPK